MLWLLIAGILPLPDVAHDRVDVVEFNHFYDGDRLREVRATAYRETWTQHDPELDDRAEFPAHWRSGLTGERPFSPPSP